MASSGRTWPQRRGGQGFKVGHLVLDVGVDIVLVLEYDARQEREPMPRRASPLSMPLRGVHVDLCSALFRCADRETLDKHVSKEGPPVSPHAAGITCPTAFRPARNTSSLTQDPACPAEIYSVGDLQDIARRLFTERRRGAEGG